VASVSSCEKLPPCLIKPVPASSKMDLLLAKAKSIISGGSASVITYFRKGRKKTTVVRRQLERGGRGSVRNNSADTKVSEEGGGGGAQGVGAETLPLQQVLKTMVRQAVPLQSMEVHGGADIHTGPSGCLKEDVTPWEACTRPGSCQDLWTHGERTPHQSRFAGRACDPVGDPCCSSLFLKDCTLWEGHMLG